MSMRNSAPAPDEYFENQGGDFQQGVVGGSQPQVGHIRAVEADVADVVAKLDHPQAVAQAPGPGAGLITGIVPAINALRLNIITALSRS